MNLLVYPAGDDCQPSDWARINSRAALQAHPTLPIAGPPKSPGPPGKSGLNLLTKSFAPHRTHSRHVFLSGYSDLVGDLPNIVLKLPSEKGGKSTASSTTFSSISQN